MKISNYLSAISIALAGIFIMWKLQFDLSTYQEISELMSSKLKKGDMSPGVVSGVIKILLFCSIPMIASLILSIMGFRRKNRLRMVALGLNILAIVYLLIPVGFLLALS